jgi:hypothetical protein
VREGTLQKKGQLRWQSRWFSAAGHYLRYWESQEAASSDEKLLAAIDVDLIDIDDPNKEGEFKLRAWEEVDGKRKEGKDILLKATTPLLAVEWVSALRGLQGSTSEAAVPPPPKGTPRQGNNDSIASEVTFGELNVSASIDGGGASIGGDRITDGDVARARAEAKKKAKPKVVIMADPQDAHAESMKKKRMTPHVKTNHKLFRDETGDEMEDLQDSDTVVEGDNVGGGGRGVKFGGGVKFESDPKDKKNTLVRRGTPHRNQMKYMEDDGEVRDFSSAELSAEDMEFLNPETMRSVPEPVRKASYRKSRPPPPTAHKPALPDGGAKRASYMQSTEEDKIRRLTVSSLDPEMLIGLEAPAEGGDEGADSDSSDSDKDEGGGN